MIASVVRVRQVLEKGREGIVDGFLVIDVIRRR